MPKSLHNARLKRGSTDSLRASVTLGVCDLLCIRLNGSLAQPHAWNGAHESMFCCLSETLFYHQLFLSHIFHLFHSTDFSAFIHSHVSHIFKIWRLFFSHTSPGFSLVALLFIAIILDKHTAATIWTSSPGTGSPDFCHHILLYLLKERSERFEHLINTTVMTQISVWLKNCKDSLKVKKSVTQSCLTLCDPSNCSLSSFSIHGILQARIVEWVAISFFRESSQLRDWTQVSCIAGRFFTNWAMREALQRQSRLKMQLKLNLDDQWSEAGWMFSMQRLSDLGKEKNQRDLFLWFVSMAAQCRNWWALLYALW